MTKELLRLGQEVVGIEGKVEGPFIDEVRDLQVPVLIGDARRRDTLDNARVQHAPAIVLCAEDDLTNAVIATGGSVVYSEEAMRQLAAHGVIVHLDLPVAQIEERLANLNTRGVVIEPGQTVRSLYDQRQGLYRRYAQITVDCVGKNHDQIVTEIVETLSR